MIFVCVRCKKWLQEEGGDARLILFYRYCTNVKRTSVEAQLQLRFLHRCSLNVHGSSSDSCRSVVCLYWYCAFNCFYCCILLYSSIHIVYSVLFLYQYCW